MKALIRSFTFLGLVFLSCAALHATTLRLDGVSRWQQFPSTSGSLNEAIPPYNGSLDGTPLADGMVCLDFSLHTQIGATWEVTAKAPQTLNELEAAYLAGLLRQPLPSTNAALYITMAIWHVFDPTVPLPYPDPLISGEPTSMAYYEGLASSALGTVFKGSMAAFQAAYANFTIYTPANYYLNGVGGAINPNSNQRFMTIGQVPEPGTMALFGGAALALALGKWISARRRGV